MTDFLSDTTSTNSRCLTVDMHGPSPLAGINEAPPVDLHGPSPLAGPTAPPCRVLMNRPISETPGNGDTARIDTDGPKQAGAPQTTGQPESIGQLAHFHVEMLRVLATGTKNSKSKNRSAPRCDKL